MSTKECPSCGTVISPDQQFCPACGTRIVETRRKESTYTNKYLEEAIGLFTAVGAYPCWIGHLYF